VPSTNLRLSEADRHHLSAGAASLGVALDSDALFKFSTFADLLGLWRQRMNLIACASTQELVERHFLDSLAIESLLPVSGVVVDLGSGAGFPGVPVAIVSSTRPVVLVEPRRRRASFLREVRRTLPLQNVEILEQRAEAPCADHRGRATAVVVRAVWSDPNEVAIVSNWLRPGGQLFWMRGDDAPELPPIDGLSWERRATYRIGTGRSRSVEVLRAEA
jgi:16S rRNA (guanine527-N7)-methyltransferase